VELSFVLLLQAVRMIMSEKAPKSICFIVAIVYCLPIRDARVYMQGVICH
jgi:hypothetical protein